MAAHAADTLAHHHTTHTPGTPPSPTTAAFWHLIASHLRTIRHTGQLDYTDHDDPP